MCSQRGPCLHHGLLQTLLAGVCGSLLGGLQLRLVLAQHALHLRLQALLAAGFTNLVAADW